ncbi:hypothetical protein N8351_00185 [Flavobacteriaceae bacterium]|nr:hypothetical protein [Flavobacteriaceae bacterium]
MSIKYLGIFNTGVLISATTITSLSPLFGIGSFNESLIILFIKLKNFNKIKLFKKFFNGYLTFNLFVGILLATITMLIFPLIMKWSKIDVIESAQYFQVFIILLLAFCIDQLSNSFKILYEIYLKYEYLAVSNLYVSLICNIVKLSILFIFKSIISLAITILLLSILRISIEYLLVKKFTNLKIGINHKFKFLFNKRLNKISLYSWIGNVSNIIIYNITNLILLKNLGVNAIAIIGLPIAITLQASQFILNSCSFLLPMFSGKIDKDFYIEKLQDSLRWIMSLVSIFMFGMIFLFSHEIITVLVDVEFANESSSSLKLFSIFSLFWSQEIVLYFLLLTKGNKKIMALNGLASSIFVLITMLLLIKNLGLITVGVAQLTRIPFSFLFIVLAIKKLELKINFSTTISPIISAISAFMILILIKSLLKTDSLNFYLSFIIFSILFPFLTVIIEIILFQKKYRVSLLKSIFKEVVNKIAYKNLKKI